MGKLFIPSERKIKGPWLIKRSDLEVLDKVLDSIYDKLNTALDQEIKKDQDKFKYSKPDLQKTIVLTSKNKTKLYDNSVLGLLKDQKINDLKPKELYIELGKRYSSFAFLMSISTDYDGTLDYSVECVNEQIKDEIKYEIDNWLENLTPNKIYQVWSNFLPYLLIPLGFFWIITLLGLLFVTPSDSNKNELKDKAKVLIEKGIDKNNEFEAIVILLKLQTKYNPENKDYKTTIRPKVLKVLIISMFCIIILVIIPKTTIGIGKHKMRLKFYKFWQRFVIISLPSAIILPNILKIINEYIFK